MTTKQQAKLATLQAAVAGRGESNTVAVIPSLPQGRLPKSRFPLDSSVVYALVNGRGHVAISANGAIDLPFVRSFPGSYFDGAVVADQLEAQCDPNGFKSRQGGLSDGSRCIPTPVSVAHVARPRGNISVEAHKLCSYFQRDDQQRALDAYGKFASERGWGIEYKMELYEFSRRAFDPAVPNNEAFSAFRRIYANLSGDWQVFRNSSGPCWSDQRIFDMIKSEFANFPWGGPVTLPLFHAGQGQSALLSSLEKMRGLKIVAGYPVMAVSKFLHFYNPSLFPIYDNDVISNRVIRCFKNDFREFCYTSGLLYESNEDTAMFHN